MHNLDDSTLRVLVVTERGGVYQLTPPLPLHFVARLKAGHDKLSK